MLLTVDFDRLFVKSNDILLDAGCGEGRHSRAGIAHGAHVCSMDMDAGPLRVAKEALELDSLTEKGKFIVHVGDALNLPFKDGTFDRVICSEVMEHVDDDNKACSELARVLKSGGTMAITVPTFISEIIYDSLTFEYFSTPGGHIRKYLPGTLVHIMKNNGLEIYDVGFKHAFHTIYWMIRCVVGLHLEDQILTRSYRSFLIKTIMSPLMKKIEHFFDYFFPKSMVIYAKKP